MILTPNYHELTKLSNSELAKTIRVAKVQLSESKQLGKNVTESERTYLFFLNEWERRLKVGSQVYR